jgi:metallo-beta-lactamase class B
MSIPFGGRFNRRRCSLALNVVCALGMVLAVTIRVGAQSADWTEPFPPHQIVGNLYYVGSRGLASYLIATPEGHVLINSSLESSVPLIQQSIEQLGFRVADVKVLLISHAHWDHCAGSAEIKKLAGARYMVMEADVPEIEAGGRGNFHYANLPSTFYPPTKVDRVLRDGDEVKLGDAVLVARHTPGHTKGTTTWTMKVRDADKTLNVVIVGSPNVNAGYKLVGNSMYPRIADDYTRSFAVLKTLPCDVFLGAHGSYYGMEAKYPKLKAGGPNPFIDAAGYKAYIADREKAFREERAKQEAAAK